MDSRIVLRFDFWCRSCTRFYPTNQHRPINTEAVARSVVFLYDVTSESQGKVLLGTGFLVGLPTKDDPNHAHIAIVTARHIVDPQWSGCSQPTPQSLFVRVNAKSELADAGHPAVWLAKVDLSLNGRRLWFASNKDDVDVALIPLTNVAQLAQQDVGTISLSDFGTKEEIDKFKIGIGDGIISAGLIPEFAALPRNYPAFKFGRISSILREPINISCAKGQPGRPSWEWLLAGNFVGGNSGSPVFLLPVDFTIGGPLQYNGPRIMLLGLLNSSIEGSDLGEMVPVEYIFDIIQKYYPDVDLYRGDTKNKPKR